MKQIYTYTLGVDTTEEARQLLNTFLKDAREYLKDVQILQSSFACEVDGEPLYATCLTVVADVAIEHLESVDFFYQRPVLREQVYALQKDEEESIFDMDELP